MNTSQKLAIGAFALLAMSGCRDKTIEKRTYTANVPVYMSMEMLRQTVAAESSKSLSAPGKIHFKGNYIYVVDHFKGIHVIDNANPASPQNAGYISLPGCVDIATKGNTLYADSYTDLVAVDISNPLDAKEVNRVKDILPQALPPTNNDYPIAEIDEAQGVVVGWKVEQITEKVEVDDNGWRGGEIMIDNGGDFAVAEMHNGPRANGKSGSMARFTAYGDFLYIVNRTILQVFNITSETNPSAGTAIDVGMEVETIFPLNDRLFIGTTTGMAIYSLSVPSSPQYLSEFRHATQCDPVVVEGNYAYITLRSGNFCGGWQNQLDVVDITDMTNPELVESYAMTNPHGLGIDNGTLFICDGEDGLKVYDASNPYAIAQNMLEHFQGMSTYDVIPHNGLLLMVGKDGLYQYDYSNVQEIALLSVIPVITLN